MAVPLRAIGIAVFIHTLWGGNPVAVKLGLIAFPPMWSAFLRFLLGTLCILAWARARGTRLWPLPGEWPALAMLSALFTVQIGVMNIGMNLTTGALSAVLISTFPLFSALSAHLMLKDDRLNLPKSAGLTVAFAGTALVLVRGGAAGQLEWGQWGNWIVLLSSALLGARLVYTAKLLRRMNTVRVVAWQMALSLPLYAAAGYGFETIRWDAVGWVPVAGIAYQGIVIAGLGFMVSSYLIKHYQPSVIVSFGFVAPISGVLLSAWLLSETVTWDLAAGMFAVGLGLYLVARKG